MRSAACGMAACAAAALTRPLWHAHGRNRAAPAWLLLLAPFLTPVLVTGYAYSGTAVALVHRPFLKECLYLSLLVFRYTVPAVAVVGFSRTCISAEAVQAARLTGSGTRAYRLRAGIWLAGTGRAWLAAWVLVFLFSFNDLELASLLYVDTWTVKLFDAQVGGLALSASLCRAFLGVAVCIPLLVCLFMQLWRTGFGAKPDGCPVSVPGAARRFGGWLYLLLACAIVTGIPFARLFPGLASGLRHIFSTGKLVGDIGVSLFIAGVAGGMTCIVSGLFCRSLAEHGLWGPGLAALLVVLSGLVGALVISLLVLGFFSLPGFAVLRDSPLPLLSAHVLVLLPYAVVIRLVMHLSQDREAVHAALLAADGRLGSAGRQGRALVRTLRGPGSTVVFWAVFYLAYMELTAAAILSPPGMTPVSVRLYNLMHYGQTPLLSAMVFLATAVGVAPLLGYLVWFLSTGRATGKTAPVWSSCSNRLPDWMRAHRGPRGR